MTSVHDFLLGSTATPGSATGFDELTLLPPEFEPGVTDVICQRGKESFEHPGNQRFRVLIEDQLNDYLKTTSRQERSKIVAKIYDQIRRSARMPSSGFVRKDLLSRRWYLVDEKEARHKVGQAFRDATKIVRANRSKAKAAKSIKNSVESKLVPKYEDRINKEDNVDRRIDHNTTHLTTLRMFEPRGGSDMGEYPPTAVPTAPFDGKLEDVAPQMYGMSPTSMLESSIQPLDTAISEKRGRHQLESVTKFLPETRLHPIQGTNSTTQQQALSNQQASSDLLLRISAPSPVSSNVALSMFLQASTASDQARRQFMASSIPWDLEPTPVRFQPSTVDSSSLVDQRTAALARLLFNEQGSRSSPSHQQGSS